MQNKIPVFDIKIGDLEKKYIKDCLDSSSIGQGSYVKDFEKQFSQFVNCKFGVTTTSGTTALHLALKTLDIGDGDEVLLSSSTNMACAFSIAYCNAIPVPIDIEKDSWGINPESIKSAITDKTKAIVMVHWAGQPCEIDQINALAKQHGIKTIEDAAHAVRSKYKGSLIGSHSDYVCFSFQAVKHLTTIDGGAIACKTFEDAERARKLRWFGLDRNFKAPPGQPPASRWEQDITEAGFKYHMNNINAAIGIAQMDYIDDLITIHLGT